MLVNYKAKYFCDYSNEDECEYYISIVELPNYSIFQTDSLTSAGGAALYISTFLNSIIMSDIILDIPLAESVWVEISPSNNGKSILVGCIYKHPGASINDFKDTFDELIKQLKLNKDHLYLVGNMNINFLKCNSHPTTGASLDMIYSNNLLPVNITKPTRLTHHSTTLIDHIYTNNTSKIVSEIVTG